MHAYFIGGLLSGTTREIEKVCPRITVLAEITHDDGYLADPGLPYGHRTADTYHLVAKPNRNLLIYVLSNLIER